MILQIIWAAPGKVDRAPPQRWIGDNDIKGRCLSSHVVTPPVTSREVTSRARGAAAGDLGHRMSGVPGRRDEPSWRVSASAGARVPSRLGSTTGWDSASGVFSDNRSKAWTERFFLAYSPVWIVWALIGLVQTGYYKYLDSLGYLAVGLAAAVPCFLVPLFVVGDADKKRPLLDRYWVKANVWVAVYSFIGNYFWTHYFYTVLGTGYTLPSHDLNDVPLVMYLLTHAYFCLYHALANVVLRAVARQCDKWRAGVALKRPPRAAPSSYSPTSPPSWRR